MAIAETSNTAAGQHSGTPGADESARLSTRQRLIEAAIEVFLENGYAKTRVQDIARRAGLTTGAMYSHFKNKAALLSEAIAQHGDIAMNEVVDAMDLDDPFGSAGVIVGGRLLAGPAAPVDRLILEALAVAARDDENGDLLLPVMDRLHDTLLARAEAARQAGVLDPAISTEALVAFLQRMVLGAIVAKAVGLPSADGETTEHLITKLFRALAADG